MTEIAKCYPELLHLCLRRIKDDSKGLCRLFENCRKLQTIEILRSEIAEVTIAKAFECCHDLRSVSIKFSPSVSLTFQSLKILASNCLLLEELTLHNVHVTKRDLDQFSRERNFPNLHLINCSFIDISDHFLHEFSLRPC